MKAELDFIGTSHSPNNKPRHELATQISQALHDLLPDHLSSLLAFSVGVSLSLTFPDSVLLLCVSPRRLLSGLEPAVSHISDVGHAEKKNDLDPS